MEDGRGGREIVSFSDALSLDEKRSCTKLATGSRPKADSLSSLSAGVFQRSETDTIHPPAAHVVTPPRCRIPARYRKLIWRGREGVNAGTVVASLSGGCRVGCVTGLL